MNIVILDAQTANPGDLSWEGLKALGQVKLYPRTPREQVVERAKEADAVFLNKAILDRDILEQLPRLKYIGILATGYNTVDPIAAREKGIPVCNAADYGSPSVAQHVFAMLLELCNQTALHHQSVSEGDWVKSPDWTYRKSPLIELAGKKMGIVGLGNIGMRTAEIAQGFGMEVWGHTRTPKQIDWIQEVSLEKLFAECDVISLHCPLTASNGEFVNEALLSSMKPSAYFINTARGGLVNEKDLRQALEEGKLAGAGPGCAFFRTSIC